jgi:hypothetical protein
MASSKNCMSQDVAHTAYIRGEISRLQLCANSSLHHAEREKQRERSAIHKPAKPKKPKQACIPPPTRCTSIDVLAGQKQAPAQKTAV